jgi:hypothetical protein
MSSGQDRPTGRQAAGAHSAGYQEEYQQQAGSAQAQGRGTGAEGYPSETVDYGRGVSGQDYPSESAQGEAQGEAQGQRRGERPGEGRRAGARAYPEQAGYGRGESGEGRYGLAAALLILSGLITFFAGITALIKGAFYSNVANYPFYYSVRSRGITEIVIGAIVLLVGVCLLLGMEWARWVAVVIATLSTIWFFMFLPFYPFWSFIVIAINVVIIWDCAREHPRRREYA